MLYIGQFNIIALLMSTCLIAVSPLLIMLKARSVNKVV